MKYKLIIYSLSFFLCSCSGIWTEHITGNYYLTATDYAEEDLSVSDKLEEGSFLGVVQPKVFEIGYDENYIIAKQHPAKFGVGVNENITNFFIIDLHKESNVVSSNDESNVIGPMTEKVFYLTRKKLKIPSKIRFHEVEIR